MSARATGAQIAAAQRTTAPQPDASASVEAIADAESEKRSPESPALVALILVGFGVLCLVGAVQSFSTGHWPAFMPPQLDLLAVPLSWLSEKLGAWVGGTVAALIGAGSIAAGIFGAKGKGAA